MKPVPKRIINSGPPGTEWFGGEVDRSTITLRVMAKTQDRSVDKKEVVRLLGCASDQKNLKHWSLHAPARKKADLDAQVVWILSRVTADLSAWRRLTRLFRVDLLCGLFLERMNRGVTLSPSTMAALGARGIELGFDIYAPATETKPEPKKR